MIEIGNIKIGLNQAPFIIAEMSGNHNQSLERALEIVEVAAGTGAHARLGRPARLGNRTAGNLAGRRTDRRWTAAALHGLGRRRR